MYGSVIGCSTQTSDGKYVQAERMFCAKIYNMQPNTNMRSNSRYKCSVSWQVLKSIVSTGKQSLHFNSASSFITAHRDRHCTMDHALMFLLHGHISVQTVIPDNKTAHSIQTTELHTQTRLQNCTLIFHKYNEAHIQGSKSLYLVPESWVSSTVFEKVDRMFILVMT